MAVGAFAGEKGLSTHEKGVRCASLQAVNQTTYLSEGNPPELSSLSDVLTDDCRTSRPFKDD